MPLLLAPDGRRLSKRDKDLDLGYLRTHTTAETLIGVLAASAGLMDSPAPISAKELAKHFSFEHIRGDSIYLDGKSLF